ncbi:MAG: phage head-tail connector protein [Phycisphaerales bacterium]|nr:phage head-tail connector protein [Phycisphaerales bacterium]
MGLQLITSPTAEPVTLAEAKLWLKVEAGDTADDSLITRLISAVREWGEQKSGRAFLGQTWRLTLDAFPDAIELTRVPILSVNSVKYVDENGAPQTLSPASYTVDSASEPAWVVQAYGTSWPTTRRDVNVVEVEWVAGYHATDAGKVPDAIKDWMHLNLAAAYANREAFVAGQEIRSLPFVDRLLDRYTVPRL